METDYLLDVVPQEIGPYYHPIATQAQAIASRSFAYWHINASSTINNSNDYQVFIPYRFEGVPPVTDPNNTTDPCASTNLNPDQQIICGAVAPRHYVSYPPSDDLPAKTQFFADRIGRTRTGDEPYLIGVDDPISTSCFATNAGHGWGMSSTGASRWARGNLCSRPPLGDEPWSVRWERAEQLLRGRHLLCAAVHGLCLHARSDSDRITSGDADLAVAYPHTHLHSEPDHRLGL